jgi:hypothetical protein
VAGLLLQLRRGTEWNAEWLGSDELGRTGVHRRDRTRNWRAILAAVGIAGAMIGAVAGEPVVPTAVFHALTDGGPTCPDFACGANHSQVLL